MLGAVTANVSSLVTRTVNTPSTPLAKTSASTVTVLRASSTVYSLIAVRVTCACPVGLNVTTIVSPIVKSILAVVSTTTGFPVVGVIVSAKFFNCENRILPFTGTASASIVNFLVVVVNV